MGYQTVMNEDQIDTAPLATLPETPLHCSRHNLAAFFIFGLVNNVIYVIFLSAAADILEKQQNIRKSAVLLANILPCFLVKLIAPYFVRIIPYRFMVGACVTLSTLSLLSVAWLDPIWLKFVGILLASLSSGLGETAFLALTSYYHPRVIIYWSSGTGAAGIIGSVYYVLFSSVFEFGMRTILTLACILPVLMSLSYAFLLQKEHDDIQVSEEELSPKPKVVDVSFGSRIRTIRPLILRYILPLFLVYYAEYTINQGVFFSLFYPLEGTPFKHYNDHYKTYSAIYQIGVFISRTFGRLVPVSNSWIFAILQCVMLVLLSCEVVFSYIGQIWIIFAMILLEGLLGGAAYVNTFCNITEQVDPSNLEFSMAFAGIADSSGIGLAGFTCLFFEPFLCQRNSLCRINRNL
ncbi:Protein BTN [Paramicrosporidium saccamoebae]|uniref:Protein BTN n=1 Tax=Paramicrosporidium saccamoebae TaxID=1246581 RepID=A0A2H9TK71_9FUNG|nr:Protein BTN [Paramicrosporidium saccamoebae]